MDSDMHRYLTEEKFLVMTRDNLVRQAIDCTRDNVMREIKECPKDHDPWDESTNGVAWLDNELDFFNSLYGIVSAKYIKIEMDYVQSIKQLEKAMIESTMSLEYLNSFYRFASLGGTGCVRFTKIMDLKRKNKNIPPAVILGLKVDLGIKLTPPEQRISHLVS